MNRFLPKAASEIEGRRWFGLDLAKRVSQLAVLDDKGAQIAQKRFATTRENLLALAAELKQDDTLALEVTTNAISIARLLRANSPARLIMSNPMRTKLIAKAKVKTDKIDARVLAELARVDYLPEGWLRRSSFSAQKTVSFLLLFDFQFHFKFERAFVAYSGMPSDPIVIAVDVAEDFRARFFDRFKNPVFEQFRLESGKEALGLRVVVTVAFCRHRLAEAVNIQQAAKFNGRVLRTAVGMNNCSAP